LLGRESNSKIGYAFRATDTKYHRPLQTCQITLSTPVQGCNPIIARGIKAAVFNAAGSEVVGKYGEFGWEGGVPRVKGK